MKKLYTNETNSPKYVGGVMVPPNEMAMIDVPDESLPAVDAGAAPTLAEQVAALLKGSVASVVAGLGALSDDALEMAAALEGGAAKPRATLLSALADERIKRADEKLTGEAL